MAKSTLRGFWRQKPTQSASASVGVQCQQFSFDPTAASAATGVTLPKGAIPIWVSNIDGGATGGTNPTVDIGTSGTANGFADELDADAISAPVVTGSLIGAELTADTAIYAGVGASAATGGTVTAAVYYVMADSGV